MTSNLPQGTITSGKDAFTYQGADMPRLRMGSIDRLPIKQCVWISECDQCTQTYYGDHKPETVDLLKNHFYSTHVFTEHL